MEQRTPEWFAARVGIPSASNFDKIFTSKGAKSTQSKAFMNTLLAEFITGEKASVIIEKLIKVAIEKTMDDDYEIDAEDGVDRAEREMEERGDDPYETEYPPGTFITGTFEDQPDGRGVVVPSKFEEDLREVFNIKNFV